MEKQIVLVNKTLVEHTLDPIEYFRDLDFDEEQIQRLFQKFPSLKSVRFQHPLNEKLLFLSEKGMHREGMVRFFANVLSVYPEFMELDLASEIRPIFDFFQSKGFEDDAVLMMMIRYPHLMGYHVNAIQKKHDFLSEMDFTEPEIKKLLVSFPQIFGVSLEHNIQPMITYLTQEIDLSQNDLKKVFMKCPPLFGTRISAVRTKLDFLIQSGFDLKTIRALTKRFPLFLRSSLKDNIQPIIELLLEYCTKQTVCEIFYKCPQCLCCSYDREILPKFHFFVQMGYDEVDLRILLEQFPEALCYSLEDEIMPTVEKSIELGLSLLQTRITFAREPEIFRQTMLKVTRDLKRQNQSA